MILLQKKHKVVILISVILLSIFVFAVYYFYPRKIKFQYVYQIPITNSTFNYPGLWGIAENQKRLYFLLLDLFAPPRISKFTPHYMIGGIGVDSTYLEQLLPLFDFANYNYIILYQYQLSELIYAPGFKDGIYHDKRTPIYPMYDSIPSRYVYIYSIEKNDKFRETGP